MVGRRKDWSGKNSYRHMEALFLPLKPCGQKVQLSGSPKAGADFFLNVFSPLGIGMLSQVCLSYPLPIPRLCPCPRVKLISELLALMGHKKPVCCWCCVSIHTKLNAALACLPTCPTFMHFFLGNFLWPLSNLSPFLLLWNYRSPRLRA